MSSTYENVSNQTLILDNIRHIGFELDRQEPSAFRIAKESYSLLLRSMVEALHHGSNEVFETLDKKKRNREVVVTYQLGNANWQKIEKQGVLPVCRQAWRYSMPMDCDKPFLERDEISDEEMLEQFYADRILLDFFSLLARVYPKTCFSSRSAQLK